jgi:hypothetical protein
MELRYVEFTHAEPAHVPSTLNTTSMTELSWKLRAIASCQEYCAAPLFCPTSG